MYHGPVDSTLDYFSSMGFSCPERKATADFLQEVVSKKDQQVGALGRVTLPSCPQMPQTNSAKVCQASQSLLGR